MKIKILKTIFLIMTFAILFSTQVMAIESMAGSAQVVTAAPGVSGITSAGSKIAGIVAAIGVAVALVMLIWIAITYITAAPSEKADIKKSATAYLIGAVLIFIASGVLALIASFADGLFPVD